MTADELLASLRRRGVTVRAEGGALLATPAERLTPADRQALAALEGALLQRLGCPSPAALRALDALPPPEGDAPVVLREAVVVEVFGRHVAVPRAEWEETVALVAEWNRHVLEAWRKKRAQKGW